MQSIFICVTSVHSNRHMHIHLHLSVWTHIPKRIHTSIHMYIYTFRWSNGKKQGIWIFYLFSSAIYTYTRTLFLYVLMDESLLSPYNRIHVWMHSRLCKPRRTCWGYKYGPMGPLMIRYRNSGVPAYMIPFGISFAFEADSLKSYTINWAIILTKSGEIICPVITWGRQMVVQIKL